MRGMKIEDTMRLMSKIYGHLLGDPLVHSPPSLPEIFITVVGFLWVISCSLFKVCQLIHRRLAA